MAATKLFKTAKEILDGYSELNEKKGRKVYLRGRALKTGNVSLYLYSDDDGKVYRQTIGETLVPELSLEKKNKNKETIYRAKALADKRNTDLVFGLAGLPRKKETKMLLIDFIQILTDEAKNAGRKSRWYELQSLGRHVAQCNSKIRLSNADASFVRAFIRYTEKDAKDSHYKDGNDGGKKLAENTRWTLCRNLKSVFSLAIKKKLITANPFAELESKEIPKAQLDRRHYLDVEDVRKLMATDCRSEAIKQTFLFCCFVGLRFGDVRSMTWKEVGHDDNGLFVSTIQQKTKSSLKAYISKTAERFLPERNNAPEDACVFNLPNNAYCNKILKEWGKAAGVEKRLTFHVSRHTSATMLLNLDVPLEVVSKQLGHKKTATTEIYAKILNKTLSAAVSKQDDLFPE